MLSFIMISHPYFLSVLSFLVQKNSEKNFIHINIKTKESLFFNPFATTGPYHGSWLDATLTVYISIKNELVLELLDKFFWK